MRIAQIVPSLEERHGGPSKSVRALANALARIGEDTTLLSTLEPGAQVPPGRDGAPTRVFPRDWPARICVSRGLRAHLATERYDVYHSHSLWLRTLGYSSAAAKRNDAQLIISPRGMMSGWAWEHHRWRKKIARAIIHPGALEAAAGWHATSQEEADDIRRLGFRQPICVAPNGVEIPSSDTLDAALSHWQSACPLLKGRRVAVFYSRFHRKKRVRELIDLWLSAPRGDWFLLLVGVPEEYDAPGLNAEIAARGGADIAAAFAGTGAPAPFAVASLFLLPSHSENFGLVIAEALASGVPALVTDTTPWQELSARDSGWCVAWEQWPRTLHNALAETPDRLQARASSGRAWMQEAFTWEQSARKLAGFYRALRP